MKKSKLWLSLLAVGMVWSCGSIENNPASLTSANQEKAISGTDLQVKTQNSEASANLADSLFLELEKCIASEDDLQPDGGNIISTAVNLADLNTGFKKAAEQDTTNIKANLGYIITKFAAINEDSEIKKMADSVASFMDFDKKEQVYLEKKGGILGLGKALAVESPNLVKKMATTKEWPKFVTISKIQEINETKVIPALNAIEVAISRIESAGKSYDVNAVGETFEVDLGEIYVLHSFLNLTKAMLYTFSMRDLDLYSTNGKNDYSWLNDIQNAPANYEYDYETGKETESNARDSILAEVIKYNMNRTNFLEIRKNFGKVAYSELNKVVVNLEKSLKYIRAEKDDQENDIIKQSYILDMDEELANESSEMKKDGFSVKFADNFKSPEAVLSFVKSILNGPYTIDETMETTKWDYDSTGKEISITEDKNIKITIDISKFFLAPVTDGKKLFPKYKWLPKDEWTTVEADTSYYGEQAYINEYTNFNPIYFVDDKGNKLDDETMDFPYFDDYTFGGIFPGMTRVSWINFTEE